MRRTKIVCTLGPASSDIQVLENIIKSGMNVARLNFSHGTHESHLDLINKIRQVSAKLEIPVAILQDLCGPKIRLGNINHPVELKQGKKFVLYEQDTDGNENYASVSYKDLSNDIKQGERVLIDDGLIELKVTSVFKDRIECEVVTGGEISSRKGVNFPDSKLSVTSLTEKDLNDLRFGIKNNVDFIAVSFVRSAKDLVPAYEVMAKEGSFIPIISKIEKPEALDCIEDILDKSYGIMVARGDLGVEMPFEKVPIVQKKLISLCRANGKPVITATQMLDSMIRNPSPTRAEVTDVANAIIDGTDAVMLSGETASGKYPVEAVYAMAKIAKFTEKSLPYENIITAVPKSHNAVEAISLATCEMAYQMSASAIIAFTTSGRTACSISGFRPKQRIIAVTDSEKVQRRLMLYWSVYPIVIDAEYSLIKRFKQVGEKSIEKGFLDNGDLTVLTAGLPEGTDASTNTIMVQVINGSVLRGEGTAAFRKASGRACVIKNKSEIHTKKAIGDILVVSDLKEFSREDINDFVGIISAQSSLPNEKIIEDLDIPVVYGVLKAMELIKNGMFVTADSGKGIVSYSTSN